MKSRWIFVFWLAALLFVHRYLFEGTIEVGRDLYRLFIPEAAFLRERLLSGGLPLWNPYVRLGQPFAATLTSEAFYPPHMLLVLVFGPTWGIQAQIVFHAALGSAGAYLASRALGAGRWAAVVAGGFAFTPLFTRLAGSLHMLSAMAWSGFVVAAALHLAKRPSLRSAALLAIPFALSFLCGAPEVVIWQGAIALGFALTSRQPARAVVFAGIAVVWCVVLCALVVVPAAELWKESVRPGTKLEDQFAWSASPAQLLSMFWPWADEKRSTAFDGPDQWLVTSMFVGAIPGMLALVSLRRNKRVAVLAIVGTLCAVLCLGQHFLPAKLMLSAPLLSGFRHPVKYSFGLAFCIALLSAQGVRRLAVWARVDAARVRKVGVALIAAMLLIPLLQVIAGLAPWRAGMKSGALWFGFCAALVLIAFALLSGKGGARRVTFAVVGLVTLELAAALQLTGHVALVPSSALNAPGTLPAQLRAEPHGRFSIDVEDGQASPDLETGRGEYPRLQFITDSRQNLIGLRPYEDGLSMVEGYGFRDPWRLTDATDLSPRGAYDVFGVTHFVRQGPPPYDDLVPVNDKGWSRAYRSTTAFPRAWVVQTARVVPDAEALDVLRNKSELLRTQVLLANGEGTEGAACESTARVENVSPELIRIHVEACAKGHLVIADSYFPGWVATVAAVERPIVRANYLLRAVAIDAGPAIIQLEYRPRSFQLGGLLSVFGWLASLGIVLFTKNRASR